MGGNGQIDGFVVSGVCAIQQRTYSRDCYNRANVFIDCEWIQGSHVSEVLVLFYIGFGIALALRQSNRNK